MGRMTVLWHGRWAILLALMLPWTSRSAEREADQGRKAEIWPGLRPDGSVMLPNQWSLRPAGVQVALGDFPVHLAVHPGSRYAAVLHCGYGDHEIVVVDVPEARVVSRVGIPEAFYGLAFSPDGSELFCSGAGDEVVHQFRFQEGYPNEPRSLRVRDARQRGVPCGLAIERAARRLWVANVWGQQVSELDLTGSQGPRDLPALRENLEALPAPEAPPADPDLASALKRDTAARQRLMGDEPFPYACVADEARGRLYVSLWAQAEVAVYDLRENAWVARWPTQEHPNEMAMHPDGKRLWVANANRNTVTSFDLETGRVLETLTASLHAISVPGSTPNSLAVSPDGGWLFVANACNNNVAVFDVSRPGQSRSLGFIPTGWYPTSVRVTPDGRHLLIANGKGLMPRSNRHGPQPGLSAPSSVREYIGGLFRGTLSIIRLPDREQWVRQMRDYTAQAYRCSPLSATPSVATGRPANSPIPDRVGESSPIRHVLYIVKENRTYDQVLGDLPQGRGDSSLCLFPEAITPNHHALAREFVLLDNFYVESEVSADGHEWSLGAYATDFVEKTWPLGYGHGQSGKFPYPSEGNFAVAMPSGGYLWDRARETGISYRSYGEFVSNGAAPGDPATARVPSLEGHIDPGYRGWDLDYPDVKRAERFIAELARFEREGKMPRLQILRLPNDHTIGTRPGKLTPRAMVADNDLALGMVIEALSRSRFWADTAVFVVEDDAQNGADHVDAHRTIAFVASPYARRGAVDSTLYSTSSMLRTIELILGLAPMSQFDAAARPMYHSFQPAPDSRPYIAREVHADRQELNTAMAWGAARSDKLDFSKEDAADDLELNEIVWRSVRGPDSPMPAPVRAGFVFAHPEDEQ